MEGFFSVTVDTSGITRDLNALGRRAAQALARGLNRAATSERAKLASDVAKDIGLKVSDIGRDLSGESSRNVGVIRVDRATGASDRLTARIIASGPRVSLSKMGAKGPLPSRGRGRGVTLKGRRYPHAFMAQFRGGHIGVFKRVLPSQSKSAGAWSKNMPIHELRGPSLARVFSRKVEETAARREETLIANISHEVAFALSRS